MREKRAQKNQVRVMLLPEYGKQKLMTYADSFKDLADVYTRINSDDKTQEQAVRESDRSAFLYRMKAHENREIMADHLNEMAQIMTEVAKISFAYVPLPERTCRQVSHFLKTEGILLKEIHYRENADKCVGWYWIAVQKGKSILTTEESGKSG